MKAISTSMHDPEDSCVSFETFQSDFIDFYDNKKKTLKKKMAFFLRIPQNLREHAIDILNDGMTMNAVSMNIGCFTRANLHLRQRFQATGRTEDRPYGGRPRVTTLGEDCYIRNTHLRNRFQTF